MGEYGSVGVGEYGSVGVEEQNFFSHTPISRTPLPAIPANRLNSLEQ